MSNVPNEFIELSVALTGFSRVDLEGTGVVELYWATLVEKVGKKTCDDLLAAWQGIADERENYSEEEFETFVEESIAPAILRWDRWGPAARKLIKMWYLGQWEDDPNKPETWFVVKGQGGQAYVQGLVWDAIGAHPPGAEQQGYGTWSLPPGNIL